MSNPFAGNSQRDFSSIRKQQEENVYSTMFDDDEDEIAVSKNIPVHKEIVKEEEPVVEHLFDGEDPILKLLARNEKRLKAEYPNGGVESSRIITSDILLKAPKTYFDRYFDDAEAGVSYVRGKIADNNKSELIRDAQHDPNNKEAVKEAYYTVHSYSSEFINSRGNYRGTEKSVLMSLIINEMIGFGIIEPLWLDRNIDEILCNGPKDVQIEYRGELYKVEACRFRDSAHLHQMLEKMFSPQGKQVSQTTPLVKGRLHDNSRIFAVDTALAPTGPNLAIRRHPEKFWTPVDMVNNKSSNKEMMSYLGNLIYKGVSMVVVGGTHSGKTSLLNALSGFYKPKARIMTLEDNLEMKPNPAKFLAAPMETRVSSKERDDGVTMRDLVHGAMQLRPDIIIVGEVTDHAAYDLVQALNTGHAGASTIHANTSQDAMPRISSLIAQSGLMTTMAALDAMASAFDIVVNVRHFPIDGSRRIVSIDEVGSNPVEIDGRLTLPVSPLFKFIEGGLDENNKITGHWERVGEMSKKRVESKYLNLGKELNWEELMELSKIPEEFQVKSEK